MTRRTDLLIALLAASGAAGFVRAQQQEAPLSAEALATGVYWVKGGSGANTGFIVGAKEVVAIDAKMSEASARTMLAEIHKATPNPVRYVVLTHSDGDHVNGLPGFPKDVAIVAQANAAKDVEGQFKDLKIATAGDSLKVEGARIELLYFGPAHTNGDLVVWLPERRIAFIGDLAFVGRDPLIHRQKGGTPAGYAQTLRKLVALNADKYVSGHNDPLTKADLAALADSIESRQAKVKALMGEGKSLDEIKAAFGITGQQGRWPSLVEVIYQELSEKK
jgi:cyclase